MAKPISDEAITKATGHPWAHWQKVLKAMDAASLPHKEIAAKLHAEHHVPGWWCQMLTVKFEQEIGRREAGQRNSGEYEVSVSKTIPGTIDQARDAWSKQTGSQKHFNGVAVDGAATLSQTDTWRYWKLNLKDGTRINVNFSEKGEGKVLLQLTHMKLADEKTAEAWREYWKGVL